MIRWLILVTKKCFPTIKVALALLVKKAVSLRIITKISFDLVNPLKELLGYQGPADHVLRKADIKKSRG